TSSTLLILNVQWGAMNARLSAAAAVAAVNSAAPRPPIIPATTTGSTRITAAVPRFALDPAALRTPVLAATSPTPMQIPARALGPRRSVPITASFSRSPDPRPDRIEIYEEFMLDSAGRLQPLRGGAVVKTEGELSSDPEGAVTASAP